jgi:hypothetical protein
LKHEEKQTFLLSAVSCGTVSLITFPSLLGVRPKSDLIRAFSIAARLHKTANTHKKHRNLKPYKDGVHYSISFHFQIHSSPCTNLSHYLFYHICLCVQENFAKLSMDARESPSSQRAYSLEIRELITGRQSHLDLSKGWMRSVLPSGVLTWAMLLRMTGVP